MSVVLIGSPNIYVLNECNVCRCRYDILIIGLWWIFAIIAEILSDGQFVQANLLTIYA